MLLVLAAPLWVYHWRKIELSPDSGASRSLRHLAPICIIVGQRTVLPRLFLSDQVILRQDTLLVERE
jgi:hypothetical protein